MTTAIVAVCVCILAAYVIVMLNNFSFKEYLKELREGNEEKEEEKPGYSFEEGIKKFSHLPYTNDESGTSFTEEVVNHTINNRK